MANGINGPLTNNEALNVIAGTSGLTDNEALNVIAGTGGPTLPIILQPPFFVESDTTLLATNPDQILVNSTGPIAVVVMLPAIASTPVGKKFRIKNFATDGGTDITIMPTSGDFIFTSDIDTDITFAVGNSVEFLNSGDYWHAYFYATP